MNKEKRAYSWQQFVDSGFDGKPYKYPDFEGTAVATIACKRWDRKQNLVAYLDFEDGRKIITSAWQNTHYYGLADIPLGSKIKATFVAASSGNVFLRGVELIEE